MQSTRIEISVKTLLYIALFVFGIYVLSRITDILVLVVLSFVLMTALRPLVTRLQGFGMSRGVAVTIVYLLLIGAIIAASALMIPPLVSQTLNLFTAFNLPNLPIIEELTHLQFTYDEVTKLLTQYGSSVGSLFSYVMGTFNVLFSLFTLLILSLYFLLEREHLHKYVSFLFRHNRDERSRSLFKSVEFELGAWVRGEFLLMLIIGLLTYVGLVILNVPYAVPLAIVAGLLEALPNLGPTLSAVPAVIIAGVSVSPIHGVMTAVLYMLIQTAENYIVVPQVMKKTVGISPITSIILILIGVRFGGVIGALLSIPLYIIVRVVAREFDHEIQSVLKGEAK